MQQHQPATLDIKQRYGDASNFMLVFNKNIQQLTAANPERAYTGTAPSFTLVCCTYNKQVLITWIMAQLENLNDFVGVAQKMNLMQMEELAQIIAVDYHYLKVTEFHLFLHRMKAGWYGEFYGTIDPLKITNGLLQFSKERVNEISTYERNSYNNKMNILRQQWAKTCVSRSEYEKMKKNDNNNKNINK